MDVYSGIINPFVRYFRDDEKSFNDSMSKAVDNRIFYVKNGTAKIFIEDREYEVCHGDVVYWRAGRKYKVELGEGTVFSGCNFDFFQDNRHFSAPIPPKRAELFSDEILEEFEFADTDIFKDMFILNNAFSMEKKFRKMSEEFSKKQIFYKEKCSAILKDILVSCMRMSQIDNNSKSSKIVDEIIEYIKLNYDKKLTNAHIGEYFNYHPNYISKLMLQHTGKSLHQYIVSYRINEAVDLLQSNEYSVGEVAERVGISDMKLFSKTFKQVVGVPPGDFKNRK